MEKLKNLLQKNAFLLTFLLVGILIAFRNPTPIFRAELWAEDGTDFFRGILNDRFSSLVTSIAGYPLFLERLLAFMASFLPIRWVPLGFSSLSLLANALGIAYFSRSGFSYIIPSRWIRILLCCLMAIGPGMGETPMNLTNSQQTFSLLGFLLLIEKPWDLNWFKWISLIIISYSTPAFILAIPLILLLWRNTKNQGYLYLSLVLTAIFAHLFVKNAEFGASVGYYSWEKATLAPRVTLENFASRILLLPWLGRDRTAHFMGAASNWAFWGGSSLVLVLFTLLQIWLLKTKKAFLEWSPFYFLCALSCGIFTMIMVGRVYLWLYVQRVVGDIHWTTHYSFLPGVFGILLWGATASLLIQIRSRKLLPAFGYGLLGLMAFQILICWRDLPDRTIDTHWPAKASEIQTLLDLRKRKQLFTPTAIQGVMLNPAAHLNLTVVVEP